MDLFEYQGKQYFARYGISVSPGGVADTVDDAVAQADAAGYPVVVKAQVQVGGRGKAGGIQLADNADEVRKHAGNILGLDIKGHVVRRLWIEHASDIAEEYYASFTLDRSAKKHLAMVSAKGGVDIETVAEEDPGAIAKMHIDPVDGLTEADARKLVEEAGLNPKAHDGAVQILQNLWRCYTEGDADLVEGAGHDLAERHVVLAGALLGDGEDLGLGAVEDLVGVGAVGGVAHLDDAGAGLHEAAQHRALVDDLGVVAGVRGGGHRRDERVQVGGAADAADLAALGQLAGDGDGVGGVAAAVQVEDDVVDDLVRGAVEVLGAEHLDDLGDGVLGEQHAAEDALLGRDVVRWGAFELLLVRSELGDAHLAHPLPPGRRAPRPPLADRSSSRLPQASDILPSPRG